MAYVYILYSVKKDRYYIGSTPDKERRLAEHNRGYSLATRSGIPWLLVFAHETRTLPDARRLEYRLKRLKDRKVVERVVTENKLRMAG